MKKKFINFALYSIIAISITPLTVATAYTVNTYNSSLTVNSKISQGLPTKYDSRDLNYISGAKNQGEVGCCWTFSTMGALESSIKKNTGRSVDFSEIHLAANNGFLGANDGGNGIIAASYFSSWQGPVYETDAQYPNPAVPSNVKSSYNGTVTNHIQDIIFVDKTKTGQDKIDNVKHNVYKYGSSTVQVSTRAIDENGTIFNNSNLAIDHEILIVGWDDNYSKDNFKGVQPNNDGAFICRNSWGESVGYNGYFYLSYEDQNLLDPQNTLISFDKIESTDNYKDVYAGCFNTNLFEGALSFQDGISELLPLEMNSINGTGIGENEEIVAVGVPSFMSNVDCELYYTDIDVPINDIADILKPQYKVKSFHLDDAGFHTIKLDNPIVPKNKNNFVFWVRIYNPDRKNIGRSSLNKEVTTKHYNFLFSKNYNKNTYNISRKAKGPVSFIAGRFYTNKKLDFTPGWNLKDNTWYYFNENSTLKTDWAQINGTWYYFDNSGAMKTGWVQVNGVWYFFDNSGAMKTDWIQVNGTWYFLDNSGAMKTDWVQVKGTWYFFDNSGAMKTGWVQVNGAWYFFDNSGTMKTGWLQSSGAWYYLTSSGSMDTNNTVDGWWLDSNGIGTKITS